jgi:hypothetical protein
MSVVTHLVKFEVLQNWCRLNTLAQHYYYIAETAYGQFLDAKENLIPFSENSDPAEGFSSERRLLTASFQTIVFSGMACEAAIYDLAAIHLGDDYTAQYIDKLDLVAKWIVVPSLISGRKLNEHGPAINSLRTLVRTRNALVHHKSLPAFPFDEARSKAEGQLEKIVENTCATFKAVILLSLELNQVLGTPTGVLPLFEKGIKSFPDSALHPRVAQVITRCREIHAPKKDLT